MPEIHPPTPQTPNQPFNPHNELDIYEYASKCATHGYKPSNIKLKLLGLNPRNIRQFRDDYDLYLKNNAKSKSRRHGRKNSLANPSIVHNVINDGGKRRTRRHRKHKKQRKTKKSRN